MENNCNDLFRIKNSFRNLIAGVADRFWQNYKTGEFEECYFVYLQYDKFAFYLWKKEIPKAFRQNQKCYFKY